MTAIAKDPSILALIDRLDFSKRRWILVDNWDADDRAVGIARPDSPRRLVYVSTFGMGPDRYAYECEEPTGPDETDYVSIDRGKGVSFEVLERVLETHLSRPMKL